MYYNNGRGTNMKNDSRKGFGIAGAIALGVAAVTALVAVTKKKSGKTKQKRSIYKPELIKLPLKSDTEPVRRRTEPKESYIRVEDPYDYVEEDLFASSERTNIMERLSDLSA